MKTKITLLCLLAFLCFIPKVAAQCTTGTQKPIDTYQATNNAGAVTINTDAKLGEYARVHIVPEKRYKFSTSVASDYVTVTTSDGSQILASGASPVYYISVYDEAVRYYIHENAQCQTTNLFSRTRYLSWVVVPPCNDPANVAVSDITSNSCKISWVEPAGVAPMFGYDVHISTSLAYPADQVLEGSSTTNSYTWSDGLNPDTTYYYWVRSDCQYQKGPWIQGGSFTTISSLVCNGALYGLFPSATFTPDCTGNEEDISYSCKTGQYSNIAVVPNTQYTFGSGWSFDFITITNASGTVVHTNGTTPVIWNSGSTSGIVRFYLNTNNQCGLDASGGTRRKFIKCTTTSATCLPPSNLAVSNITSNSCRLAWTAPAAAPAGYEIYMVTNTTAPVTTTTATLTSTTAGIEAINGLTAGVTYYYWIRSNCGSEKSTWASGGSFTVNSSLSCNGAIYGLYPNATFTPVCTGSAEQIASDCWAGEYSNVNVSANKQYTFMSSVATDYITITNTAGTAVIASGVTPLNWASGSTSGVVRYHLNTNAGCGAQNTSRIRSVKCIDAPASCGVPTALSVSNITSNSSRLNWAAPAAAPGSYDLYIITSNTAPVANTAATATSTTAGVGVLNGLSASATYYYWIRSNCGTGKSAWVSGGNFTTIAALSCNGAINGLYPDAAFTPACSGSAEQIVADAWAGEYSNVNVVANKQYTFTSSIATDYLTITNATGTVVFASGLTPLSWASGTTSGVVRYHLNTNANCGTQNTSRVRSIKCIDAPVATCGLPSGLAVSNITSDSCRLTWTAPASAPTYYDVYAMPTNTAPVDNTVATISSSTPDVQVLRWLAAGTNYHYWVRSICGSVKSAWVAGGSFDTNPPLICNTAMYGLYPEDTITLANTGNAEPVAIQAWAGGYSNVNVLTNKQYVFTSSIATDYLTITNATGTELLASGVTPVSWASGAISGIVRFFVHTDPNCGTQDMPRTTSAKSTVLGIDENIADSQLKMYPNPSAGQLTVETANIIADNIMVIDNLGRIISTHKPDSAKTTLTIDGFSDGVYYVKIKYQDKDITKKLVLKKN